MAKTEGLLRSDQLWNPGSSLRRLREDPKFKPLILTGIKAICSRGLSRGNIAEVRGTRSSGKTSVCHHILAEATQQGEVCAVIDTQNAFDPQSAAYAGVQLNQLIWVQCHSNSEHAMRAADLFLHAGGFGIIWLDLAEVPSAALQRIPLSYWHRFRRAIENTPTILVICTHQPQVSSSSINSLEVDLNMVVWSGTAPFVLLRGVDASAFTQASSALQSQPILIRAAV